MKKITSILFALIILSLSSSAQQMIEKADIEFEVKTNIKKTLGESPWAEMLKESVPTFKIAYYHFIFNNNQSLFKWDHFDEKNKLPEFMTSDEQESTWYLNHNTNSLEMKKSIFGTPILIKDSIPSIEWKLTNEQMNIAGFNCRKAIGKIFDSVYVFAFYAEEIPISGGPCSISGLPGMVLGMTIPRLYTSWMATKINVTSVKDNLIQPIVAKKPFGYKEFGVFFADKIKDWGDGEDGKDWRQKMYWTSML